jgi:hypothetical protein
MLNLYPSNIPKTRVKKEAKALEKETGIKRIQALNEISFKYTGMSWDASHKKEEKETTLSIKLEETEFKLPYKKSLTVITSNSIGDNLYLALELGSQLIYQGRTIYFVTPSSVPNWQKERKYPFVESRQFAAMYDFAPNRFIWLSMYDDDFYTQKTITQIKQRPGILIIDNFSEPYEYPEEDRHFIELLSHCEHAVIATDDLAHLKRFNLNSFEQKNKQLFIGVSHRVNYRKLEIKDRIASVRAVIEETLSSIHLPLTEDKIAELSTSVNKLEHMNHYRSNWTRVFRNKIEQYFDFSPKSHFTDLIKNRLKYIQN